MLIPLKAQNVVLQIHGYPKIQNYELYENTENMVE